MAGLDADALFTNTLLHEKIDIYIKKLSRNSETLVKRNIFYLNNFHNLRNFYI